MCYDPYIHHRKSIRLKGYDYSKSGMYFITICTQNMEKFFGEIKNQKMILNDAGKMIEKTYIQMETEYKNVIMGEFVIMPNHFHCIIEMSNNVGVPLVGTQSTININEEIKTGQPQGIANTGNPIIGDIIGAFKSITTNAYIKMVKQNIVPSFDKKLWQRNYYENIIKNEATYNKIVEYIKNNPSLWNEDKYFF